MLDRLQSSLAALARALDGQAESLGPAVSKALTARGIKHTFRFIKGGGHAWSSGAIQSAMQVSFPFVAKGFASPPKKAPDPQGPDKGSPDKGKG